MTALNDEAGWVCTNPEHAITRVICECPWFNAVCHECPLSDIDVPACMTHVAEPAPVEAARAAARAVIPPAPKRFWADLEDPDYEGSYFDYDEELS